MKKATTTMKKTKSGVEEGKGGDYPSQQIDARIKELNDWRGEMLARIRSLIKQADPDVGEEVKWRKPSNSMLGVPVWSRAGMICTGETYKNDDLRQGRLASGPLGPLQLQSRRQHRGAIDFHEANKIDEKALQALIRAAVALNTSVGATARPVRSQKGPTRAAK